MSSSETSNHKPRGLFALIVAQFFGVINDNLIKGLLTFMVIDGVWQGVLGEGGQGLVNLCFTLPFLLLSGWGGQFTERRGKREAALLLKGLEIPIAGLGLVGALTQNLWLTMVALLLLSCQSAYFGPAKYGMLPDLMGGPRLARANGFMNLSTNVAAIAATMAAGIIADRYAPKGSQEPGELWLPGICFVGSAVVGFLAINGLPRSIPKGRSEVRYDRNPVGIYIASLREMAQSPLLRVTLAWGYFYLFAGLTLLIVPEYTVVLDISRAMAGRILGVLAIAVGLGCFVAGLVARRGGEGGMVIFGGCGLSVAFVALGLVPPTFANVCGLIFLGGFLAGFYIIPLQAMIQELSPEARRGRLIGTANAVSFAFMTVANVFYWLVRPAFGDTPQHIFTLAGAMMVLGLWLFFAKAGGLGDSDAS